MEGLRIGTHCGENEGEQLTSKFGRLANEKSPLREAFVYHLLDADRACPHCARGRRGSRMWTPRAAGSRRSCETRCSSRTMTTSSAGSARPAKSRMEQFTTARELFAPADTARLAFAQAMIANFDWCLRFYPDDTYRCDAKQPLWNISAFKRADGPALPVIADFDLAGMVVGSHNWFDKVYFAGFVPSHSSIEDRGSQPGAADALAFFPGAAG